MIKIFSNFEIVPKHHFVLARQGIDHGEIDVGAPRSTHTDGGDRSGTDIQNVDATIRFVTNAFAVVGDDLRLDLGAEQFWAGKDAWLGPGEFVLPVGEFESPVAT